MWEQTQRLLKKLPIGSVEAIFVPDDDGDVLNRGGNGCQEGIHRLPRVKWSRIGVQDHYGFKIRAV